MIKFNTEKTNKEILKKWSEKFNLSIGKDIDKRKKHILVLDTETAGEISENIYYVYDFAWAIMDKQGNILAKKNYVVKEIFEDEEKMKHAFYANKMYLYAKNNIPFKKWNDILNEFMQDIIFYNVSQLSAYNLSFDIKALNFTNQQLNGKPMKVLDALQQVDIWTLALQTLATQKRYVPFCIEHNFFSKKGNILTNAEVMYAYITNNPQHKEEHTALSDTLEECKILAQCYRQHKKLQSKFMWRDFETFHYVQNNIYNKNKG